MKSKKLIFLWLLFPALCFAQKETFDIATYTPVKGWVKKSTANAVQFTKTDAATGGYCMMTVYKSATGTSNSKDNFDRSWISLVKEPLNVTAAPQMQPPVTEEGWEAQSGYANFEANGSKGLALLVTSSSAQKVVNILILTNTNVYQKEMDRFLGSVSFQKQTGTNPGQTNPPPGPSDNGVTPAKSTGFTFSTTNFDDGWVATVQDNWVEVTKANLKVLVHYPDKKADAYNSVVLDGLKNAWDILVAPRYSNATNMEFKPITGWQSIEFGESDLTENKTGKRVHVVLFKMNYSNGSGRYLEFITPDKKTFEAQFGAYHQTSYGWENLEKFANYNKFAVAAADLEGRWTNDFSGAIQYVNANTGLDSYMDTHASVENFTISASNTYSWELNVASGAVGNIKFQNRKSTGKITMNGNWKATFSDIEGRARTYDVYFSCIKGLRVLWLDGRPFAKAQ